MSNQFNVRLEKLHQQMLEAAKEWNREELGRKNVANKILLQEALEVYFMKLCHSDPDGILKICRNNQYEELLKLIKFNEVDH